MIYSKFSQLEEFYGFYCLFILQTEARMVAARLLGSVKLPVHISSYDGLRWSEDNQLAVITRKGVYVYEVTPDISRSRVDSGFHLVKTFVENESELAGWQLESVLAEEELGGLERGARTRVMMDRVTSPHMAAGEVAFKQPTRVGDSIARG